METNQNNTILDAMKTPQVIAGTNKQERVNSSAESVLNVVATLGLCIGIIAAFIILLYGIDQLGSRYTQTSGAILCGVSILTLILSLIQWAFAKTFINMSRNLFNLNYKVESIKDKLNL